MHVPILLCQSMFIALPVVAVEDQTKQFSNHPNLQDLIPTLAGVCMMLKYAIHLYIAM